MTFKNPVELESYFLSKIHASTEKVEEEVYRIIDRVLAKWYGEYDPVMYQRTKQLLHSLVKSEVIPTANGFEAEVYFDTGRMNYSFKMLGKKMYPNNGPSGEEVLQAAMQGGHGAAGWNIAATTTPVWSESVGMLDPEVYEMIKQALAANGIPVKE